MNRKNVIPTNARKSTWYGIPGTFIIQLREPLPGSPSWMRPGTLEFQPRDKTETILLFPESDNHRAISNSAKVLHVLSPISPDMKEASYQGNLYLRHIRYNDSTEQWGIIAGGNPIWLNDIIKGLCDEAGYTTVLQQIKAHATPIPWPAGYPNDEIDEPIEPSPVTPTLDPEIWNKLAALCRDVLGLEVDQVQPEMTFDRTQFDSLDGVELMMSIEEHFDIDIDDDDLENLFGPSSTLLNLYQYIHDKLHEKEEQNPKQKGAGQ